MEFFDFPRPVPPTLYAEAATAYAALVEPRVHAVYRTGRVNLPGISDLDLIVVPRGPRYDNSAYFSLRRLPGRLRTVFRHNPFVLPMEHRGIMRYSSHAAPKLVGGRDVLPPRSGEHSLEERWSTLLEDYCHYERFIRQGKERSRVAVRFLLSKLNSIRIPVLALEDLSNAAPRDPVITAALDHAADLRRTWFDSPSPSAARAAEGWDLLCAVFDRFETRLRAAVGVDRSADVRSFAHAFLRGERVIDGIDVGLVHSRQVAIREYLIAVADLGIRSHPLVFNTLFRDELQERHRRNRPHVAIRVAVRVQYRLEEAVRNLFRPIDAPIVDTGAT